MLQTTVTSLKAKKNSKKGFTLMEMLIVVAIIGILVAIAIPTFSGALDKAKKATDDANIRAAYAQYQVNALVSSDKASATQADKVAVTKAFGDIGVDSLEIYDTITVPANGSKWVGSGDGGSTIAAATITIS